MDEDSFGSMNTMKQGGTPSPAFDDEASLDSAPTMRPVSGTSVGHIDQYELVRKLGGGGFGVVWLVRDTVSGVEYALKTLHPLLKTNEEELERVRDNFALVAKLSHPNIATAHVLHRAVDVAYASEETRRELRVAPGDPVMLMSYAPGVTLSKWRKQFPEGRVPLDKALEIARQVASALDYAHGERIVHRDIKPGNVMVETDAETGRLRARVLDFGLAAEIRSSMSRVSQEGGDTSGTRPYMAPEQWEGRKQDGRSDQYALACVAYELLSGEPPFAGAFDTGDSVIMERAIFHGEPESIDGIPDGANAALLKALAKKREDRFGSCGEFVDALEGKSSQPSPVSAPARETPRSPTAAQKQVEVVKRKRALDRRLRELPSVAADDAELSALAGKAREQFSLAEELLKSGGVDAAVLCLDACETALGEFEALAARRREEAARREAEEKCKRRRDELGRRLAGLPAIGGDDAEASGLAGEARGQLDGAESHLGAGELGAAQECLDGCEAALAKLDAVLERRKAEETARREAEANLGRRRDALEERLAGLPAIGEDDAEASGLAGEARGQLDGAESHLGAGRLAESEKCLDGCEAALANLDAVLERRKSEEEVVRRRDGLLRRVKAFPSFEANTPEMARWADEVRKQLPLADGYLRAGELGAAQECLDRCEAALDGLQSLFGRRRKMRKAKRIAGMAVALAVGVVAVVSWVRQAEIERKVREEAERIERGEEREIEIAPGVKMAFVWVAPGSFRMGADDSDAYDWEKPVHEVTLTKGYWLGKYEVTQAAWQAVMGNNPSHFKGERLPVESVSWDDCLEYVKKVNDYLARKGEDLRVRLPTEAEWEFAARGGTKGRGFEYSGSDNPGEVAWYTDNSGGKTHEVGTKAANELGIHDMSGNVWEWCADWCGGYSSGAVTDPRGPGSGDGRVRRGGGWSNTARYCRSAYRGSYRPDSRINFLGVRLASGQ